MASQKLGGVQSLRALAALLVVFHHITFYSVAARKLDPRLYLPIDFGRVGVCLFFVISGFVMAFCLPQGRRFLINRVVRIYPAYWVAIALSWIIVSGLFEWHFTWASFFLIPADLNNSYWIPYWTLCYEMVFYLLLSIGAAIGASARALALACGFWVVAIVAAQFGPKFSQFEPRGLILLSSLNLYFIAGLLLGLYGSVVKQLQSWKGLAGLLIVLSTLLLVQGHWIVLDDFLGACCCAAVVALAVRYLHVRWLEKIGNISFGIYLVHIQLIVMTTRVLTMHFPFTRLSVIWLTAAVVAVGGSTLFGWIELNLHAWLKHPVRPRGAGHGPGATKMS